jgi:hypothetical protein
MDYEQGLERLKRLANNTTWYYDVLNYEARLRKNLQHEKLYGMDPATNADRAQIVDQLNRLAAAHVGKSFNDLCKGSTSTRRIPIHSHSSKTIFDSSSKKASFAGVAVVGVVALILIVVLPKFISPSGGIFSSGALCQYDATNGFKGWINSPQWSQLPNGTLGSGGIDTGEGSDNYMAWTDCNNKLSSPNYAVEAQIKYIRASNTSGENSNGMFEFGIMLHGDGNTSGYEVGVGKDACGDASIAMISLIQNNQAAPSNQTGSLSSCSRGGPVPLSSSGSEQQTSRNYNVDTNNFHTYRATINNQVITLYIDSTQMLQTSDNTFINAGQVGLRDIFGDITVKSFTVTALS